MASFCTNCGTQLPEGSVFCPNCGAKVAETPAAPAPRSASKSFQQAGLKATGQINSNPSPQPVKKKGLLRFTALLLVVAILFTGFVKPGFFKRKNPQNVLEDFESVFSDSDGTTTEETSDDPEEHFELGNSKKIAYSPCEGVFVSAEENAFWQDTEVKIQPVTEADETLFDAVDDLEEEGVRAVAAFEVDAGLEDGEVIPGTYTVSIDLSVLGIDESLYDHLCAYRVADDGTYYQYASRVEGGKLIYSSDQNSITLLGVFEIGTLIVLTVTMVALWAKNLSEGSSGPIQYFLDTNTHESKITRSNDYVTYTLRWLNKDIGVDDEDLQNKMKAIEEKYKAKSDELYKNYEENKFDGARSILNIFSKNKSVEEIVAKAIKEDPEYQKLAKEIALPEPVEYAVACIDMSFKYLKEHEYVKMPSGVVEITSAPGLSQGIMGLAVSRLPNYPWVHIDLSIIVDGDQDKKDSLLVTLTHELLHVCQRGYRHFWTDSARYDEMVAVVVENRAADWYKMEHIIDYDSNMAMCDTRYWGTLKLPIDVFFVEGKNKDNTDIMRNEGYNLGLFALYLEEKTGRYMWGDRLMRAVCSYKEGGVSKPLMKAFEFTEQEFENYYRLWVRKNKSNFSEYYNQRLQSYKINALLTIEKGGKYSVSVSPEGSYSSEVRGFKQKTKDPMILLMVPDSGFSSGLPGTQLLPCDRFELFNKGAYIPARDEEITSSMMLNRNVLEITGVHDQPGGEGSYTIYVLDKTAVAACDEDEQDLILRFPAQSKPASDGIIDGCILTITTPGGGRTEKDIPNSCFDSEFRVPKEEYFAGNNDDSMVLALTLCEYVKDKSGTKYKGEESEEFTFEIHRSLKQESNWVYKGMEKTDQAWWADIKKNYDLAAHYQYVHYSEGGSSFTRENAHKLWQTDEYVWGSVSADWGSPPERIKPGDEYLVLIPASVSITKLASDDYLGTRKDNPVVFDESVRISADMKIYKNGEVIASASADMIGLNSASSDQKTKTGSFSFPIAVNTASLDSSCELVITVYGDQYEYHYMYGYQMAG